MARVWHPNVVPHQVQQVSYVPQTVAQQVPVQVCSYQPEQVHHQVPYQTCRIVQEECVRQVPFTVCRPVVERVERHVPVTVCRMVAEDCVQHVAVQTCKMVYEERVEHVPYQVCRMAAYEVDGRHAALRGASHSGDVHVHRAADGLLPRAGQRLRRADCRAAGADAGKSGDEAELRLPVPLSLREKVGVRGALGRRTISMAGARPSSPCYRPLWPIAGNGLRVWGD